MKKALHIHFQTSRNNRLYRVHYGGVLSSTTEANPRVTITCPFCDELTTGLKWAVYRGEVSCTCGAIHTPYRSSIPEPTEKKQRLYNALKDI